MSFLPFPSGTVIAFAGANPPSGWLLCDGTAYNQADYPELFQALSTTYNTQTNPTTGALWTAPSANQFRVPDYRGVFLRGIGTPSGLDTVTLGGFQTQKTKPNGLAGTAGGQSLGTTNVGTSASGITNNPGLSHDHDMYVTANPNTGGSGIRLDWDGDQTNLQTVTQLGGYTGGANSNNFHSHSVSGTTNISHSHSPSNLTLTGDIETRPNNVGVSYAIKI